jgi:hypothetical protein
MVPITSLIFPAAFLVALLLPECELWLLDRYWHAAPREVLVDFVICKGTDSGISADICARLEGPAAAPEEDDDFGED